MDKRYSGGDLGNSLGGTLGGLGHILEKLVALAERGQQLQQSGQLGKRKSLRGIYGLNVQVGLGDHGRPKVGSFGNVRPDESGEPTVLPVREPMTDLFEEEGRVHIVAETPGVAQEDVQVELSEDILTLLAERGDLRYHKEVLLPQVFRREQMTWNCRNGVVEIDLTR